MLQQIIPNKAFTTIRIITVTIKLNLLVLTMRLPWWVGTTVIQRKILTFNPIPTVLGFAKTVGELISVIMVTSIFHIVISRLLRLVALRQLALIFIILYINMMDLVTHITGVQKKQTFFKLKKMKIYQLYRFILVMLVLHMKFQYTN